MFKANFDYELLKKYLPDDLSMERLIYSHYKTMANIKELTEEKQKMQESFDKYKKRVEAQQ